jgi:hypothetical protein
MACTKHWLLWLGIACAMPTLQAQTYRWKDERGVVQYGDRVPPQYKDSATVELSSQAIPLKKVDAALSPEERARADAKRAAEAEAAKQGEIAARADRALMSKYANQEELSRAHIQNIARFDEEMATHTARAEAMGARAAELMAVKRRNREQRSELEQLSNDLSQIADVLTSKLEGRIDLLKRQREERARFAQIMSARKP